MRSKKDISIHANHAKSSAGGYPLQGMIGVFDNRNCEEKTLNEMCTAHLSPRGTLNPPAIELVRRTGLFQGLPASLFEINPPLKEARRMFETYYRNLTRTNHTHLDTRNYGQ